MRPALIALAVVVATILIAVALPTVFVPKRWAEIQSGQTRQRVFAIVGQPDADYFTAKGFDGWHNHFYIGATVLKVTYARDCDIVAKTDIRTYWGFSYQKWAHDYAKNH
jgi:hypothetical protein